MYFLASDVVIGRVQQNGMLSKRFLVIVCLIYFHSYNRSRGIDQSQTISTYKMLNTTVNGCGEYRKALTKMI